MKSVTIIENSAVIHHVPLQHLFILSEQTRATISRGLPETTKKFLPITRRGIPHGIANFFL